ncbi:MAG: hypothetical protein IKE01_01370 [Clostridia bacterium]|nr:hypothetical protein [Clostridia bacterium]
MERKEKEIIDKICLEQNFDELLLNIKLKHKSNKLNKILTEISEDERMSDKLRRAIYEDFFDYVIDINNSYIASIKDVYCLGAQKAIREIYKNEEGMK